MMQRKLRVTVWNEFRHERTNKEVASVYPDGIHTAIAGPLQDLGHTVETATLDDDYCGLPQKLLAATDVLIWWGHAAHDEVSDTTVDRVHERILAGMGFIALHSAHHSLVFKKLMGTSCSLRWREDNEKEVIWIVNPAHPICDGLDDSFKLDRTEMYGEFFDIPTPDELVFISSFAGGEVFRSGCCFTRGRGKVFYFRPGHETLPIYYDSNVKRVIANAILWAAPGEGPSYKYADGSAIHAI